MTSENTNVQSIFARETSDLGGILEKSSIPTNLPDGLGQSIYNWAMDLPDYFSSKFDAANDEQLKKVYNRLHCNLVNNLDLNAFAFKSEDRYFIGINAGTIMIIEEAFFTLLSHPSVLPEIGDIAIERKKFDSLPLGFPIRNTMSLEDILEIKKRYSMYEPQDIMRWHYCGFLTKCAMDFLIRHEVAHIMFGHVDYMENIGVRPLLPEISYQEFKSFSFEELQALEFQADTFAAQSYALLLGDIKPWKVISIMLGRVPTLEELMRGKLFALAILFRLFAQNEKRPKELSKKEMLNKIFGKETYNKPFEEGTHPRSIIRFQSCVLQMRPILEKEEGKDISDTFEDVSKKVFEEVENMWSILKLPGPPSLGINSLSDTEICDLTMHLLSNDLVVKKTNEFSPIPFLRKKLV